MIKPKEHPCRGTGVAKGHGCGKKSLNRKYGLSMTGCRCYQSWLLTSDAGKEKLSRSTITAKKSVTREIKIVQKQKTAKMRDSATNWKIKLQSEIQRTARLIDNGLLCPVRPKQGQQLHGGHTYAKGGNREMAYNLHNVHRQSAQSNHMQSDDGLFKECLAKEYGSSYLSFISFLRGKELLKYSNIEFKEFYQKAKDVNKELLRLIESGELSNTTPEDRIRLRNHYNRVIGFYDDDRCFFIG